MHYHKQLAFDGAFLYRSKQQIKQTNKLRKQTRMTPSVGFAEISTHILIENIIAEIKEQYLADNTPWIVGFSGGKDSTTLLQLTFFALV